MLNDINNKIKDIINEHNGRIDHVYFDTSAADKHPILESQKMEWFLGLLKNIIFH